MLPHTVSLLERLAAAMRPGCVLPSGEPCCCGALTYVHVQTLYCLVLRFNLLFPPETMELMMCGDSVLPYTESANVNGETWRAVTLLLLLLPQRHS